MSTPFRPTTATIKYGNTTVGNGLIVGSSLNFSLDVDEFYGMGDQDPTLIKGHKHYGGRFRKAWLDHSFFNDALAGYVCDIVFTPVAGKTLTVKNAILRVWDFTMDEDAVVLENMDFVGDDIDVSP